MLCSNHCCSPLSQVDNLKKSLVEVNGNSSPSSVKSRLQQVSDLEAEVAAVDEEIVNLKKETENNAKSLNRRKVQHINTLQQLGKREKEIGTAPGFRSFMGRKMRAGSLEAKEKWRVQRAEKENCAICDALENLCSASSKGSLLLAFFP